MARIRRHSLRGSVRQNVSVRMSARGRTRLSVLTGYAVVGLSALAAMAVFLWLWRIEWPQRQAIQAREAVLRATASAHFVVKDIVVDGRNYLDRDKLLTALGVSRGSPILEFDPALARAKILALPWVADVRVERRLPDSVHVTLRERIPMARWQNKGQVSVIDEEGLVLREANSSAFAKLPLVVGAGAPAATHELFGLLRGFPRVVEDISAAARVGERRWDLYLRSGAVVKLPEDQLKAALGRLEGIIAQKTLLQREIKSIDLRLPDRLIIQSEVPVSTDSPPHFKTGEHRP